MSEHNKDGSRRNTNKAIVSYMVSSNASKKRVKEAPVKPKTILQAPKLSLVIPILYEGVDVTPISLNPYLFEGTRERQISILDTLGKELSTTVTQSLSRAESQKFHVNVLQQQKEMESQTMNVRSYISTFNDDIVIDAEPTLAVSRSEFSRDIDRAPYEDDEESVDLGRMEKIPETISLILTETETIFLLDKASCTASKGTKEGDAAEEDNKLYEFLTKGKGRNRKVVNVAVQTIPVLMKSRDTEPDKLRYRHGSTFVSNWEMYDTYQEDADLHDTDEEEPLSDEEAQIDGLQYHKLKDNASLDSYRMTDEEKQLLKLVKNKKFLDALLVIERILASNCYNDQQKRFKGLADPDALREDVHYKYRPELLWTYANDSTEGRCVTVIAFNCHCEDLIAVGYGKFYFIDRNTTGAVMLWNIKNPKQPERHYEFPHPVTSLDFAKNTPNMLAVGFYNGEIKILDVSKRDITVIREDATSSFEPVWDIRWFRQNDGENLMASFGDGGVFKYQMTDAFQLKCIQIMRTARAEGKLKGVETLKKCEGKAVAISNFAAGRCLALHPADPSTYFVGTSEGVVHRCSTNYYNQHMDLFRAHNGPIHTIKFSPFANKLFYTCGDDFRARLWIDGIHEPLVTSQSSILPVMDVDWSPLHPSVIASVRGGEVFVWDLQRKMYAPQSHTKSPTGSKNIVCRFSLNGRCLFVGDIDGNVHVFSLEDMPIAAFFSEDLVLQSIKRLLVTRPDLIRKLDKIGSLNFDQSKFSKYFN